MEPKRKVFFAKAATILGVIPILMLGYQNGPDPANTGAPGDQTCAIAGCHTGTGNPTNGGVTIDFPQGPTYTPGVTQRWVVRVTGAMTAGYGFQATARPLSNERGGQAGRFNPINATTFVICLDGQTRTGTASCRPQTPIEFIEHTMPSRTNSFTFDWTPPATDIGNVRVYVAGNAANLNGQNTGDQIFMANFTLTPQAAQAQPPQIRSAQPVLQAFSGMPALSSGTWIEIYGTNLSATTREWAGGDFTGNAAPTSLDGVRVNVNNRPAFVRYVSPTQVNVQAPDDTNLGDVDIEVVNANGSSRTRMTKTAVSPALLTTPLFNVGGKQYVAALHTDFQTFVGRPGLIAGVPFRAAKANDTIIVFAVGCGPTNPASPAGQFFPDARPLASPIEFRFGSTVAEAQGFLAAGAIGLCQFNVRVPNLMPGDVAVEATVNGVATGQNLNTTIE